MIRRIYFIILILFLYSPSYATEDAIPGLTGVFGGQTEHAYTNLSTYTDAPQVVVNEAGANDTITCTGCDFTSGFSPEALVAGDTIVLSGTANDDDTLFIITNVAATTLTLAANSDVTGSASATVTITEKPTIYVNHSATAAGRWSDALSYSDTRNGVPVVIGGWQNIWQTDKNNKIVLFEWSGVIDGGGGDASTSDSHYAFYAGQTAPSPGLEIIGWYPRLRAGNVVMQHLRLRPGDWHDWDDCDNVTAMSVTCSNAGGLTTDNDSIIFDHMSFSAGIDGNVGIGEAGCPDNAVDIGKITIANSIIGWSLNDNCHSEDDHGCGLAATENDTAAGKVDNSIYFTLYRTLIIHNMARVPRVSLAQFQAVNMASYQADKNGAIELGGQPNNPSYHSYVGSIALEGTVNYANPDDLVWPYSSDVTNATDIYMTDEIASNCLGSTPTVLSDYFQDDPCAEPGNPGDAVHASNGDPEFVGTEPAQVSTSSFSIAAAKDILNSSHANYMLDDIGARPVDRGDPGVSEGDKDWWDYELVEDVLNLTGSVINCVVDDGDDGEDRSWSPDVGACDDNSEIVYCDHCNTHHTDNADLTANNRNVGSGTFPDGIGVLPSNPHNDDDSDGYTNLEEWLHKLAWNVETGWTNPPQGGDTGLYNVVGGSQNLKRGGANTVTVSSE